MAADVTAVFAAKDESFAATVDKLQQRLAGFSQATQAFTDKVGGLATGFSEFAKPIAAMAAAFLGARSAAEAFRGALEMADSLQNLATRTGETSGNLSVLQEAFHATGSSAEAVGPTINKLQDAIVNAGGGSKDAIAAFASLGLSFQDLAALSPTEQLQTIGNALAAIPDPAQRTAAAINIFGKSGGELIPVLTQVDLALASARDKLGSLPDILDNSGAGVASLSNTLTGLTASGKEFAFGFLAQVAPLLDSIAKAADSIDFAGIGQDLGDQFLFAFDLFAGVFMDPSEIFGFYGEYLNATFSQAGDDLATAMNTGISALTAGFAAIQENKVLENLGEVLSNAFVSGVATFDLALLDGATAYFTYWGDMWNAVSTLNANVLLTKLRGMLGFFSQDWVFALTSPAQYIALQLSGSLIPAVIQASETYATAFDAATGSYVEKARAGLDAVAAESGGKLEQSAVNFGDSIVAAGGDLAKNTDTSRVNLFDSEEKMSLVKDHAYALAEKGAEWRASAEVGADAVKTAKGDAHIITDTMTGPGGLTDRFKAAMDNVDKLRAAIDDFASAGREVAGAFRRVAEAEANARAYERAEDRAHGLRERGYDTTANSIERKARESFVNREIKSQENFNNQQRKDQAYADAESAKSLKEANRMRIDADRDFAKTQDEINHRTNEVYKKAAGDLGIGADDARSNLSSGGTSAGNSLKDAGQAVKDMLTPKDKGKDPLFQKVSAIYTWMTKNLPSNAMS
jgi:hypothetical protein